MEQLKGCSAILRGCSAIFKGGGAAVSAAPTKQTGRKFPQNTLNTQNLQTEMCLPQIGTDFHR